MTWEFTGNHYLAIPCIDPLDGAIHGVNVLHAGMASLVSWTGSREPRPQGPPLLRIGVSVSGEEIRLENLRWERLDRWIPRFTVRRADGTRVTVTYCAPGGFDPLVAGGVITVQVENAGEEAPVRVWLDGSWAWSLRTVASTRPARDTNRVCDAAGRGVVLETGDLPAGAALAVLVDGPAPFIERFSGDDAPPGNDAHADIEAPNGVPARFRIGSVRTIAKDRRATFAFMLGVGPERDGATLSARRLHSLGAEELLRRARLDLASLNRITDEVEARDLVARNLVFHHYWAAARAIDDDRLYPVMSRSPGYGPCAVFGEREALAWSLPAYALTDPLVARELLLRILEVHSDRPGNLKRYVDGGILDAGFSLGRACEYALAIDAYIDVTRDAGFADEPLVQQVLREMEDIVYGRLHAEIFLGSTEVLPGGERADYPYCAYDNVLVWRFCRTLERQRRAEKGEPRSRLANGEEEIEAAFWQRFTTDVDGLTVIAYSSDLKGHAAVYDDPAGSLRLLPHFGFCPADDPIWTNTMELLHSRAYPLWLGAGRRPGFASRSEPRVARFSALCADLLTSRRPAALDVLRALDLPGGVACGGWDPATGGAASEPYAASEAGFLVWALFAGKP